MKDHLHIPCCSPHHRKLHKLDLIYGGSYQEGYDVGFEKGKRYVLSNHSNYIRTECYLHNSECFARNDQYDVLAGTTLTFYGMNSDSNKRIVVREVDSRTGSLGNTILDTGYTSDTEASVTLDEGGNIAITLYSQTGSGEIAWYKFENSNY